MRWFVTVLVLIIVVAAAAVWGIGGPQGPSLREVASLKEPRIVARPSLRVITVELTGDPADTFKVGCRLLYRTYSKLPSLPGSKVPAPLVRWPKPFETPRREWLGRFALPVPDATASLPEGASAGGVSPRLATWEGGMVAEILHVGPYATETPTVARLRRFIAESGYEICGEHEEEYLRSSGMLFKGDPATYLTVIRYPVRKRGSAG